MTETHFIILLGLGLGLGLIVLQFVLLLRKPKFETQRTSALVLGRLNRAPRGLSRPSLGMKAACSASNNSSAASRKQLQRPCLP